MLHKYILVCHYGSRSKNDLHISQVPSIHKPHLLPLPPVFLDKNNFFIPSSTTVSKKFTLSWKFGGGGGGEGKESGSACQK